MVVIMTNVKGITKTLEVVIAASILLAGLGFMFMPKLNEPIDDLRHQGYDALEYLDDSGKLRNFAKNNDNTGVSIGLDTLIDYKFKAVFCKITCDSSGVPDQKSIVVIDHYISGYPDENCIEIDPKKLRLYLWE